MTVTLLLATHGRRLTVTTLVMMGLAAVCCGILSAQSPKPVEFDVVSIKRVEELRDVGGMRTLPDGTFMMMNQSLDSLVGAAAPVPVGPDDILGMPGWMMSEPYDVTAKPPPGSTRDQLRKDLPAMWKAMFVDRMKLAAHIEQRERNAYELVLARNDGLLGSDLRPSTLDCTSPTASGGSPSVPQTPSLSERQNRCGVSMSRGLIVSGGITMDQLALNLRSLAGGEVENRTGLEGRYALVLRFSQAPAATGNSADDAPDFFTAVQEQLGLKLQRHKKMSPVFIIDHIERPTPD